MFCVSLASPSFCQATRFDVAVRALRGEFDPPPGVDNTERNPGLLLESLMQFPGTYSFQVRLAGGSRGGVNHLGAAGMGWLVGKRPRCLKKWMGVAIKPLASMALASMAGPPRPVIHLGTPADHR